MILINYFTTFVVMLGVSLAAYSYEVPSLTGPVVDEVGILGSSTKRQLESSLQNLYQTQRVQLQVLVTNSLQGEDIASVAIQVFDKWKLGDEKTDKGLLFIIAPNEKRMRIEVGQGLEGDIPDVIAKRIISDVVRPYFQRGELSLGIVQGVSALQNYIGSDDPNLKNNIEEQKSHDPASRKGGGWIIFIIIGIWILIFIFNPSLALYILFNALSGGRGGGGGGSWSGGGGRSSGGGASGGW